ncbi:trypsin-like serine protease [Haloechinothrix halophila]|uniref:trypsin-like serine protease n=1 Tax=Haloechinothrix halophila TaxID=1069073 RepID=UPI0012F777F7|nr:trypsin-like serine protease [Haloechinothrix halophila]
MKQWTRRAMALVAASAFAALGVAPGTVNAQETVAIQPGVSIESGGGYCTLNWIYDGEGALAGSVYGGTAAHCVESVGERISLATGSLGDPIQEFGTVAYIDDNLDYAFIEIDPALHDAVDPAMKGHPAIPTGVSTTETANVGDTMQFSGNGVGFHLLTLTQEERTGILHSNDGTQHYVIGAVSPGDSGGPVADVTDGNKAFGIVNTVGVGINGLPYAGEGGVSLEGMFADAAEAGFTVALRTV